MCHNHDDILRSNNKDLQEIERQIDRRNFLTKTSMGLGAIALGSLLNTDNAFAAVKNGALDRSSSEDVLKSYNKNRIIYPRPNE